MKHLIKIGTIVSVAGVCTISTISCGVNNKHLEASKPKAQKKMSLMEHLGISPEKIAKPKVLMNRVIYDEEQFDELREEASKIIKFSESKYRLKYETRDVKFEIDKSLLLLEPYLRDDNHIKEFIKKVIANNNFRPNSFALIKKTIHLYDVLNDPFPEGAPAMTDPWVSRSASYTTALGAYDSNDIEIYFNRKNIPEDWNYPKALQFFVDTDENVILKTINHELNHAMSYPERFHISDYDFPKLPNFLHYPYTNHRQNEIIEKFIKKIYNLKNLDNATINGWFINGYEELLNWYPELDIKNLNGTSWLLKNWESLKSEGRIPATRNLMKYYEVYAELCTEYTFTPGNQDFLEPYFRAKKEELEIDHHDQTYWDWNTHDRKDLFEDSKDNLWRIKYSNIVVGPAKGSEYKPFDINDKNQAINYWKLFVEYFLNNNPTSETDYIDGTDHSKGIYVDFDCDNSGTDTEIKDIVLTSKKSDWNKIIPVEHIPYTLGFNRRPYPDEYDYKYVYYHDSVRTKLTGKNIPANEDIDISIKTTDGEIINSFDTKINSESRREGPGYGEIDENENKTSVWKYIE